MKDNKLLCFYYSKEREIICRTYENNKWGRGIRVLSNTRPNFTVTIGKESMIYLFCQENIGDIVLCTGKDDEWKSKVILKNQSNKIYPIQLYPIITDDGICLTYNVPVPDDNKSNYIVFQKLDANGQWSQASRIDKFVSMQDDLYKVQSISNEHMILFYQTRTPENNLGYREINPYMQGDYNIFHSTAYNIIDSSFLTTNNTIHVLYIVKSMFSTQLLYRKKESKQFSNPITIWEGQKINNCLIFFANDKLYATYTHNGQLFYCISENKGISFSRPARYKNKFCLNPVKSTYISETPQSENTFYCRQLYVDNLNLCDIQLLPDLYEDFYLAETNSTPIINNERKNYDIIQQETYVHNNPFISQEPYNPMASFEKQGQISPTNAFAKQEQFNTPNSFISQEPYNPMASFEKQLQISSASAFTEQKKFNMPSSFNSQEPYNPMASFMPANMSSNYDEVNEKLIRIKNQLAMSEKQNQEKDKQIIKLTNLLKSRNDEISMSSGERQNINKKYMEEKEQYLIQLQYIENNFKILEEEFKSLLKQKEALENEKEYYKTIIESQNISNFDINNEIAEINKEETNDNE